MKSLFKSIVPATLLGLFIVFILLSACSKDNPVEPKKETPSDSHITTSVKESPSYMTLENLVPVSLWDIKFFINSRSPDVALNSGAAGSAGVSAANLGVVDFNAETDLKAVLSADKADTLVIGDKWYNYDFMTHTISSKNEIYLIKSVDYNFYKLRLDGYTQGKWTMTISPVDEKGVPTDAKTVEVTATETEPGLLSLGSAATVTPENWDVAFLTIAMYIPQMDAYINNPALRINSIAGVEIATVTDKAFDEITSVLSGLTFVKDEGDNLAVGDAVLNYDPSTHVLTPPDVVYIVKAATGKHYKLKVTSYYDPETGESGYFSFRLGTLD